MFSSSSESRHANVLLRSLFATFKVHFYMCRRGVEEISCDGAKDLDNMLVNKDQISY